MSVNVHSTPVLTFHNFHMIKMCEFRTLDTAVGELEYYMESFNTTKLSIQQPDNVDTLIKTLAVAAANFLLMLLCFPCPPDKATGKLGLIK
jgi:hypothetical protein